MPLLVKDNFLVFWTSKIPKMQLVFDDNLASTGTVLFCNMRRSKRRRTTRDTTAVTRDRTGLISPQSSV